MISGGPEEGSRPSSMGVWAAVAPVSLLAGFVFLVVIELAGLYFFHWTAAPILFFSRILPFPAASVNGSFISYKELDEATSAFVGLAEEGQASIPGAVTRQDIARNVLNRLIQNKILFEIARERGIVITDIELETEYRRLTAGEKEKEILQALLHSLGWSSEEMKERVIKPVLIARRLEERLGSSAAAEKEVQKKIDESRVKVYVQF